ncbi:ras-related protein Rab-3D isoform X1 [Eptesicus fuscus]|uniref:ras-related protein Rab-3D isoform X1 n=1 Tax=Eptesicus fuscus TaxID=29078 RepID=UPI002403A4A2|nr:ras-related protein Rab-3D isoform X1 [Eptesicus fuscus]XP_054573397.1 ras-related protein Rab-3D isoform X1 [Eptesicus fuscus]
MASAGDPPTSPRDAADQNFDYMFKLLLIGNSSVGKTSFLFRYADDSFTPAFVSTVGIDFKVKTVYRHDKRIKLQIWDTAGQERYRTITTAYYRGAMGFLLMYDVANQESFTAVQDWATQIKTYSWDNAQVILVGNKCDLEDERVVLEEDGRRLADDLGFEFFEASAKENINVKQVFERLVDVICVLVGAHGQPAGLPQCLLGSSHCPHPFCAGRCLEFTSWQKVVSLLPHALRVLRVHPWRCGRRLLAQGPLL